MSKIKSLIVICLIFAAPFALFSGAASAACPTGQTEQTTNGTTSCVSDFPAVTASICPEGTKQDFTNPSTDGTLNCVTDAGLHECGSGSKVIKVRIDFGCRGQTYGKELNPILDIAFAIFRFLSAGVGLVVIGSIIFAGIQYSSSRGNPQMTEAAIKRVTNAIIGLLIYIFMFAILNFIIPGGMFV